jgi:outer membrane protein OmpA-like peptidoglycan-associated protein
MIVRLFSYKTFALIIPVFLLFAQRTQSQVVKSDKDLTLTLERDTSWEIGISGGVSKFGKSINPNPEAPYKKFNYWKSDYSAGFSASVIKNFSTKISAEVELFSTKLSGTWNSNSGYLVPPLAIANGLTVPKPFETSIKQINAFVAVNLNQLFKPQRTNDKWYIFAKGGVGVGILKANSSLYNFPRPNEGVYSTLYGGGVAYRIKENIKLKAGVTFTRIASDRLDGIHELIPGKPLTGSDANYFYNIKERFAYPYVAVTYRIGRKKKKKKQVEIRPPQLQPMRVPEPKVLKVPEVKIQQLVTVKPNIIGKTYSVYYGFDKWDLNKKAMEELDKLSKDMLENPPTNVELRSHTDSRGPAKYNMMLSEIRGKMAQYYILGHGITQDRVESKGYGETQLLNKCADGIRCTEAEHAVNRRTETIIKKK